MLLNPVYQVLIRCYIVAFFVFLFPAALIIVVPQITYQIHDFALTGRIIVSKTVSVITRSTSLERGLPATACCAERHQWSIWWVIVV